MCNHKCIYMAIDLFTCFRFLDFGFLHILGAESVVSGSGWHSQFSSLSCEKKIFFFFTLCTMSETSTGTCHEVKDGQSRARKSPAFKDLIGWIILSSESACLGFHRMGPHCATKANVFKKFPRTRLFWSKIFLDRDLQACSIVTTCVFIP